MGAEDVRGKDLRFTRGGKEENQILVDELKRMKRRKKKITRRRDIVYRGF